MSPREISRRALLGALVGGTTSVVAASIVTESIVAAPAFAAGPTTADWRALARTLAGPVYLPGTSAYAADKQLFDPRWDANRPAAVARVRSTADVQRCVAFANRYGLAVAPRAGGHSYVGASAANRSLVLDVRDMSGVSYAASGIVTVGAGARLYHVHEALAARGRSIPTGTCPTVGAAGLTLGGGIGVESREHGLTSDRLVGATVVLPSGRIVAASARQNTDVFWALRGGGGGAVGIVTSLQYATYAVGNRGAFTMTFPASAAVKVLVGWARWCESTARSRWAGVHVTARSNGTIGVSVVGVTRAGDQAAAAASLAAAIGVRPLTRSTRSGSFLSIVRYLGGGTTSARQSWQAGSDVLGSLGTGAASAIVGQVAARARSGHSGVALLDPLSGAVRDLSVGATAFPWRRHVASVQWYAGVSSSASAHANAAAWISASHRALARYSAGGYVNYLEPGLSASHWFGANATRWRAVRASADPRGRLAPGTR